MLRRALSSVRRQIVRDYEIIVVDDGSSEDIAAVVVEVTPNARVVRLSRNHGIAGARNAGLAVATGQYIAFLDSDDIWHPRYLHFHRAAYESEPEALFTFTDYYSHGPRGGGPVRQLVPDPLAENALLQMIMRPFVHTMSCWVAPRLAIAAVGGLNETLPRFSDLDLYVRLLAGPTPRQLLACEDAPVLNIPQILVRKTQHTEDRSLDAYAAQWAAARVQFLDGVFAFPFMAAFAHLRPACDARLIEGQMKFFANFAAMETRLPAA